ncbi:MAG TPA: copper resistance protein CopC [Steroidobacteraceae bacterium]|nr:copper resistance protein CopC [Steroidobacteraceae bacterium]
MTLIRSCALAFLVLMLSAPAFQAAAHSTVQSTSPPSGATLEQSPPAIEMHFHAAISLTAVVVVDASKAERKIEFTPHGSATVFQLTNPQLAPGHNEVKWKGLSKDGHVVSGTLTYQIKPKEAKAS